MKKKPTFEWAFLFWALGVAGCASHPLMMEKHEEKFGKAAPVISQSFASPQISSLDTWKVYLIASDPDGDMENMVCTIDQPGVGTYPVSITRVGPESRRRLSGYIYLNPASPDDLNAVDLTLTVQVQDKAGHYSRPATFPLSINNTFRQEPPPPGVFRETDLGPVMIRLRSLLGEDGRSLFPRREFPHRR